MTTRSMKRLLVTVLGAALLVVAAPASAAGLKGTVVHHNRAAHSFVVATRSGKLYAIHANRAPRVGQTVRVNVRRLLNGTFVARRISVGRVQRHVRLRGIVTFRNARGLVVSARGASLFIRRSTRGARAADATGVGEQVEVDGTVDDQGDIEADSVTPTGAQPTTVDLEGRILSLDPNARTLTLSADDDEQSGATIVVTIPVSFDFTVYKVGGEVELQATPTGPGTFTAVQSSGDDNAQEADDHGEDQGDGHDGQQSGTSSDGEHSGTTTTSSPTTVQHD